MVKQEQNSTKLEKETAERIWLDYFNRYLLESGTISQKEYAQMSQRIAGYHKNRSKLQTP